MSRISQFFSIVVLGAFSHLAQAQSAADELVATLADVTSLQGNFTQTLTDETGEVLETSAGRFVLQKPGRFFWLTKQPFEQQLISNGKTIWLYDPDLLQVTVRQVNDEMENSPALLLSNDAASLSKNYQVERAGANTYTLTPKQPQALFDQLSLGFVDGQIQRVQLIDALGQSTLIAFSDAQANAPVDEAQFEFEVPDDVDVLID